MRTIELSRGQLQYEDTVETGSGPPVVLLHGLLMDHTLWDPVMPLLPTGHHYVRPVLPLGSHRIPMRPDADLTIAGMAELVAEFLDALELDEVTLVHNDWGGALFLTALGLDARVARQVILPCEAFDNFPPGVPGALARLASRVPGGIQLACRQLRVPRLQRLPFLYGQMTRQVVPVDTMRRWTEPVLTDAGVRRDVRKFVTQDLAKEDLVRNTEALRTFSGEVLVVWSPDNKVMPPDHGRRLADLIPGARYSEISRAGVLLPLDDPVAVAQELADFIATRRVGGGDR